MKKLLIKTRNGAPREKNIRVKNKIISDLQAANYLLYDEEFLVWFPVTPFLKFFGNRNYNEHKRN